MFGNKKTAGKVPAGHFDTLISGKTKLVGDVHFSGGLHVDGRVEGSIRAEEGSDAVLRISEVGEVEGDVHAPHIVINGTVRGDVYATEDLELASKAAIHGNVYYNLVQMAMGAAVNGSLMHCPDKQMLEKQESPAQLQTSQPPTTEADSEFEDEQTQRAEA